MVPYEDQPPRPACAMPPSQYRLIIGHRESPGQPLALFSVARRQRMARESDLAGSSDRRGYPSSPAAAAVQVTTANLDLHRVRVIVFSTRILAPYAEGSPQERGCPLRLGIPPDSPFDKGGLR